jgi:glyoxylase-like metal-dependent hydrolase (beta-lactamase superfamily II)
MDKSDLVRLGLIRGPIPREQQPEPVQRGDTVVIGEEVWTVIAASSHTAYLRSRRNTMSISLDELVRRH